MAAELRALIRGSSASGAWPPRAQMALVGGSRRDKAPASPGANAARPLPAPVSGEPGPSVGRRSGPSTMRPPRQRGPTQSERELELPTAQGLQVIVVEPDEHLAPGCGAPRPPGVLAGEAAQSLA